MKNDSARQTLENFLRSAVKTIERESKKEMSLSRFSKLLSLAKQAAESLKILETIPLGEEVSDYDDIPTEDLMRVLEQG